ncbi:hypothetical protein H9Q74_013288 [Fusarium xylarioides]|nr:hypothetical protein H9Q71_012029 [Fusarium xylarioides]KAG5812069.1 hypothetical protein H9Q74_013288 [Fusarium xylarioides]
MHPRCALCGIAIPCSHHHNPDEGRVWWRKVFAVQRENDQSPFSLEALGYAKDGSLEPRPIIPSTEGFFTHQACWPIFRDQMFLNSGRHYKTEDILQVLFDFIQSIPRNGDSTWVSYLCPENEGAVFHAGGRNSWEFLRADPSIFIALPITHCFVDGGTYGTQASSDLFSKLSTELSHCIINLLDTVSFFNLRLASTTIANLSKPVDLPQSFWASRFSRDHEMNFFSMDLGTTETWRDLYFNVKRCLEDGSTTGHMRNRKRIWNGLQNITPCLISMLRQRLRLENTARCREELVSLGYQMTQKIQGFEGVPDTTPSVGIQATGSRYLNLRLDEAVKISVSRVYLDKRYYICGFRATRRDGSVKFHMGLIQPDAETRFIIWPSHQVIAIKVASTFGGIIGLAFRIKDELGGLSWKLVGKVDKPDEYVGINILKPENGPYIRGLLLGLDACKVVSIQLVENLGDSTSVDRPTSGKHAWHPAPPQLDVVTVLPHTVDTAAPQPAFLLNMDFGGPSGSLLPLLNRITLFHDDIHSKIRGLGFYYTDGTKREFGFREIVHHCRERRWSVEQSLFINGPAGERITGVGFRTEQHHGGQTVVDPYSITPNSLPLAFNCSGEEARSRVDSKDVHLAILSPSSSVRFNGIKRVGISNGRAGRNRQPDHVSGFCFEFLDGRSPIYVGQWFQEIGHLDLDIDDRLTGLMFWDESVIPPIGFPQEYVATGRFSGVRIEKSGAAPNAVEVHPGPTGDMHETRCMENMFEKLDGFVWATRNTVDRVQVVAKPSLLAKNCLSRMPDLQSEVSAKSEKLFWEIESDEEDWTNVSQISVFFNPDGQRLCGMEFLYWDEQTKRAGYTEGAKTTLILDPGELVTGASWKLLGASITPTFDLSSGRRMTMHADGTTVEEEEEEEEEEDILDGVRNCQVHKVPRHTCEVKRTEGARKCVGVFLSMGRAVKASVNVHDYGAVYVELADEEEEEEQEIEQRQR